MHVSVTTPRGSLIEGEFDEVIGPGVLGEFDILPGHIPFLSALKPGVLILRRKHDQATYAVGDGLLEVVRDADGSDRVLVLVGQATSAAEVDRAAANAAVAAADKALAEWNKELGAEHKALVLERAFAAAQAEAAARAAAH